MFICDVTKKSVGPHISPIRIVVETRPRVYRNQVWNELEQCYEEKVSHGTEIVKEIQVGPEGFDRFHSRGSR